MAGIGFELRRMLRKDTLLGLVQAYAYASVIGSGPWVLSIVGILLIGIFIIFSKGVMGTAGFASGFGPYLVAMLIWALGLSLGGPTGYALNPARDLGPRIAHAILPIAGKGSSDWGYAMVPVVGPMVGGVLAFVVGKAVGLF